MTAISKNSQSASCQRTTDRPMPFPPAHRYRKRIDLTNQPQHESQGKFWDDNCGLRYPPAKRNDYAPLSSSCLINMIGVTSRLKDKFDIFGGLPDTIEDDWIESVEKLEAMMDQYIHLRQKGRDVFELRYKETIDPDQNRWELCSRVLARKDVVEKLSEAW